MCGLLNMKDRTQHAIILVPPCSYPSNFMNENESNIRLCLRVSSSSMKIATKVHSVVNVVGQVCRLGILAAGLVGHQLATAESIYPTGSANSSLLPDKSTPVPSNALKQSTTAGSVARAQFGQESASEDVRKIADWIVDSHNNQAL